ncbi:MAG: hypothetical protein V1692_01530 [bacterium]
MLKENNLWSGGQDSSGSDYYFQPVRLPVLAVVLLEIILIILTDRFWSNAFWWADYDFYITLALKVIAAFWAAWLLLDYLKKKTPVAGPGYTAGAVAGLTIGLIVAIFKIFWYHQFWTFFNLISEPLLTALVGACLVRWFAGLLDKMFKHS